MGPLPKKGGGEMKGGWLLRKCQSKFKAKSKQIQEKFKARLAATELLSRVWMGKEREVVETVVISMKISRVSFKTKT